jgi:DNA-binding transcriptional regulator YdaS (Cro superfamily)
MKLGDWLAAGGLSPEKFAKEIGVSGEAVRRYRVGARMPGPEIAQRIYLATRGEVTVQDLHEQCLAFLSAPINTNGE